MARYKFETGNQFYKLQNHELMVEKIRATTQTDEYRRQTGIEENGMHFI